MAWRCFMAFAQEGGPLDEDAGPAPDSAGAAAVEAAGPSGAAPKLERAPLRKFDRNACPALSAILRKGETAALPAPARDRKSAVEGKRVSVRVDIGGARYLQKKNNNNIPNNKI